MALREASVTSVPSTTTASSGGAPGFGVLATVGGVVPLGPFIPDEGGSSGTISVPRGSTLDLDDLGSKTLYAQDEYHCHPVQDNESDRNQSDVQLMPTFDADTTDINAFEVEDADLYIFSQYFDQEEVFDDLREWYDSEQYRFEVPADEMDRIESFLDEYFYDLNRVAPDDIEPFCVVKEKYTDHADILRNSAYHTSRGSNTVFVMQDRLSAEQAVGQGATPLADSDTSFRL